MAMALMTSLSLADPNGQNGAGELCCLAHQGGFDATSTSYLNGNGFKINGRRE